MVKLNELKANVGSRQKRKRVGRGHGSGQGQQAGRGHKGQGSRAGGYQYAGHEGGQKPLYKRTPKLDGFTYIHRIDFDVINVSDLEAVAVISNGVVSMEQLKTAGIIRKTAKFLKVLGNGEIKTAVTVQAHRFSKSAKDKIEKAKGKVEELAIGKKEEK